MSCAASHGAATTTSPDVNLLKRYRTALARHHRSRGFGIHSPSAYHFVTQVLGERLPYYAYDDLRQLRRALRDSGEQSLISNHDAQLLFRIAGHFAPQHILLVGADSALTIAALLMPSSQTDAYTCGDNKRLDDIVRQLDKLADRVLPYVELKTALFDYMAAFIDRPKRPFVVINALPDPEHAAILQRGLNECLQGECVVIIRNLHRDPAIKQLWHEAKAMMPHGHSYTNHKTAILVARPAIPREHFDIWL